MSYMFYCDICLPLTSITTVHMGHCEVWGAQGRVLGMNLKVYGEPQAPLFTMFQIIGKIVYICGKSF